MEKNNGIGQPNRWETAKKMKQKIQMCWQTANACIKTKNNHLMVCVVGAIFDSCSIWIWMQNAQECWRLSGTKHSLTNRNNPHWFSRIFCKCIMVICKSHLKSFRSALYELQKFHIQIDCYSVVFFFDLISFIWHVWYCIWISSAIFRLNLFFTFLPSHWALRIYSPLKLHSNTRTTLNNSICRCALIQKQINVYNFYFFLFSAE